MKKPNTTKITEGKATTTLFNFLNINKIKKINRSELKKEIFIKYEKEYKCEDAEAKKYFSYIFNHALKMLRRENILEIDEKDKNIFLINIKEPEAFEAIPDERYEWVTENTISNIYELVGDNKHLLPSFQRPTAWKQTADYKELAYSIYRSVPLGIMYMWKINNEQAAKIKHFSFKRDINPREELNFKSFNKNEYNNKTIFSVIDGQQRLTGINVIINGTLGGKKLFFNERQQGPNMFAFRKQEAFGWNKMEDIYNELHRIFKSNNPLKDSLIKKLSERMYISFPSLKRFYEGFFKSQLLAICEISEASIEEVLDVFIRTNKFGKKLSPADIVLSKIVGDNNDIGIRKKIEGILKELRKYKNNFSFASTLKLISTYFTGDPKMDHLNFKNKNIELSKKSKKFLITNDMSWKTLLNSITFVIKMLKQNNFDSKWINSDNSLIPIIFWHTRQSNKLITNPTAIKNITNYLLWSQLLKHFNSSTDDKIKKIIILINNKEFSGWKLGTATHEANVQNLIEKIDEMTYESESHKSQIKIILGMNKKLFKGSNSIEHLKSQKNRGSHRIWNLSLLPVNINSELQGKELEEKIRILMKRYKKDEHEVREALWIPLKSDIRKTDDLVKERKLYIQNKIEQNLK